jgi:tape measure domain-containing protein
MRTVSQVTEETCDRVADRLDSLGSSGQRLAILGASLTAAFTLPLEEVARRSLDVAGNFEQTTIAFQTLLGSASEAKSMLSQLYSFASSTPFEIPQVLDGARKLMALGFASKDVIPILRVVGDQAAAMGSGGVGMDRILMNLGKIEAQGKITGHELRNLGEDNVPALESLALALGKTKEQVSELVSKGQVDSGTAINAILRGMQLRTGGLMESQMSSFKAQLSNMADQITMTANAIGEALLPVGKTLVNWAQEAIGEIRELAQAFTQLPAPIQASAIALASLAALTGPALAAIGGVGMALPAIATGFGAITKFGSSIVGIITSVAEYGSTIAALASEEGVAATAGLVLTDGIGAVAAAFLGVPALIAAGTVALAALGTWVYTHWDGVKAALAQVFDGLGEAWNATLGVVVNWLNNVLGGSATELLRIWTGFKGAFIEIWDAVGSVLHRAIDGFKSDLQDLVKLLEKIPGMQK